MTVVALGGAMPMASGATRSLAAVSLLVLAAAVVVLIRALRIRALGASAIAAGLALTGLVTGMQTRMVWVSVLAFLALLWAVGAFVVGLVQTVRGPQDQGPGWRPPSEPAWQAAPPPPQDTAPGWRPEGAPPWQPKSPS